MIFLCVTYKYDLIPANHSNLVLFEVTTSSVHGANVAKRQQRQQQSTQPHSHIARQPDARAARHPDRRLSGSGMQTVTRTAHGADLSSKYGASEFAVAVAVSVAVAVAVAVATAVAKARRAWVAVWAQEN
ncbi:unnamed protein product [Taenia asiatica]|uniref:Uncharacterized protein n=1 Tax=Taenia asiatica TaxID=60517 RepID=A0A0R3VXA7_TAEAS|nr:unnamed protein product [Taenia asiatica]